MILTTASTMQGYMFLHRTPAFAKKTYTASRLLEFQSNYKSRLGCILSQMSHKWVLTWVPTESLNTSSLSDLWLLILVLDSIYHTHLVDGRYLPGQYTSFLSDEGVSGGVCLGVIGFLFWCRPNLVPVRSHTTFYHCSRLKAPSNGWLFFFLINFSSFLTHFPALPTALFPFTIPLFSALFGARLSFLFCSPSGGGSNLCSWAPFIT